MIKIDNLTKSYGPVEALKGISFEVGAGEVVGLLGPNGAGKSTAIKILTGYLHPDAGSVEIDGLDVLTHTREVQARIGYLAENTPLYPNLSVQAYLKLIADMRGISADQRTALISEAIYATGLVDHRARLIGQLSKGLRQRVGLAQAILHKPKLLILDEPTVGLDPTQIVEIRHLIERLSEHSTILFSSHILSEVEAVCDRVLIIMNGLLRADAWLDELSANTDAVLILAEAAPEAETHIKALPGVVGIRTFQTHDKHAGYRIQVQPDHDVYPALYELCRAQGWPLRELRQDTLTLEAFFNQLATTAA